MKKAVLIVFLGLLSQNLWAMGYPQSTVAQQRVILGKDKRSDFYQKVQIVQDNIADKISESPSSFLEVLIKKISNFFIEMFIRLFSNNQETLIAVNVVIYPKV